MPPELHAEWHAQAIQTVGLSAYRPGTAAELVKIEERRERRARLWRWLDQLTRSGTAAQPTGRTLGANEGN